MDSTKSRIALFTWQNSDIARESRAFYQHLMTFYGVPFSSGYRLYEYGWFLLAKLFLEAVGCESWLAFRRFSLDGWISGVVVSRLWSLACSLILCHSPASHWAQAAGGCASCKQSDLHMWIRDTWSRNKASLAWYKSILTPRGLVRTGGILIVTSANSF